MSIPEKHHHAQQLAARNAIAELRALATAGDLEAVAALRDVALHVIDALNRIDLGDVPQNSYRWPAALDAVAEIRKVTLARWEALEVGSAIGIRLSGKRHFNPKKPTGFALEIYQMIEPVRKRGAEILDYLKRHPEAAPNWRDRAALLPELSKESLSEWVIVALEVCEEIGMGDWNLIPLPASARGRIGKDPSGDGWLRTAKSALYEKVFAGLKSLI